MDYIIIGILLYIGYKLAPLVLALIIYLIAIFLGLTTQLVYMIYNIKKKK